MSDERFLSLSNMEKLISGDAVSDEQQATFRRELMAKSRPSRKSEYHEWLAGFSAVCSNQEAFLMEDPDYDTLRTLIEDLGHFVPLYGRDRIHLLVPQHIQLAVEDAGHSSIYFLEDFTYMTAKMRTVSRTFDGTARRIHRALPEG